MVVLGKESLLKISRLKILYVATFKQGEIPSRREKVGKSPIWLIQDFTADWKHSFNLSLPS